jgi:hypothetical protein
MFGFWFRLNLAWVVMGRKGKELNRVCFPVILLRINEKMVCVRVLELVCGTQKQRAAIERLTLTT